MVLVILGLDGMNFELISYCKKWMPNMMRLLEKSAQGTLKSVFPPLSGPAWVSILTGKPVGEHGFVNSFYFDNNLHPRLLDPEKITYEHFYEKIWKAGGKVFLMDVPFSSSRTIDGDFLDSYFSSKPKSEMVKPQDLTQQFPSIQQYINYKMKSRNFLESIDGFKEIVDKNGAIIKEVMEARQHDLMFFQLTVLDWMQHKAFIDLKYGRNSEQAKGSLELLQQVDDLLGWMMDNLYAEDYFFIFSDHGAGQLEGTFFINTWLQQQGYLTLKWQHSPLTSVKADPKHFLLFHLTKIAKSNRHLLQIGKYFHRRFRKQLGKDVGIREQIDTSSTKAACLIKNIPIITIFEDDPEEKEKIIKNLKEQIKKELGFDVVAAADFYSCSSPQALSSQAISSSEALKNISLYGDLVVDTGDAYDVDISLGPHVFLKGEVMFHNFNSLFIAKGPEIEKKAVSGSIIDIAPTILNLYGISDNQGHAQSSGNIIPLFASGFKPKPLVSTIRRNREEKMESKEFMAALDV